MQTQEGTSSIQPNVTPAAPTAQQVTHKPYTTQHVDKTPAPVIECSVSHAYLHVTTGSASSFPAAVQHHPVLHQPTAIKPCPNPVELTYGNYDPEEEACYMESEMQRLMDEEMAEQLSQQTSNLQ